MKDEQIDKIWIERKYTLDELYLRINWLIKSNKPVKQKLGIWKYYFDIFVKESFNQDYRIRSAFDPEFKKNNPKPGLFHMPAISRAKENFYKRYGVVLPAKSNEKTAYEEQNSSNTSP